MSPHLLIRCLTLLTIGSSTVWARIWNNTSGQQMEADLVSATDTTVTVRRPSGTITTLSLEALSGVDTVYVKEWLKKNPPKARPKAPVPPATPPTPPKTPDKPTPPDKTTPPGKEPGPSGKPASPDKTTPPGMEPAPSGKPTSPGTTTPPSGTKPTTPEATKPPLGAPKTTVTDQPVGFDGPWPKEAKVADELGIEIIKEDDGAKSYIYRSSHFQFSCNVQLRPSLVNAVAKVFETTHEFLRVLPLNHRGTGYKDKFFPVLLFETFNEYVKAGGPPGSAGVCRYSSVDQHGEILVPLTSLGVKKVGKDYAVDSKDRDFSTLSHEITHQLMEGAVKQAYWYVEGSAEYIANTHYHSGRFQAATNKSWIIAAVTGYGKDGEGGRALGKNIRMPALKEFMEMAQPEFMQDPGKNYGLGCLLTFFFYHLDGEGDAARIKAYIKELQNNVPEKKAREKLLDGRTWDDLAKEFAAGMRRNGVKIEYAGD